MWFDGHLTQDVNDGGAPGIYDGVAPAAREPILPPITLYEYHSSVVR